MVNFIKKFFLERKADEFLEKGIFDEAIKIYNDILSPDDEDVKFKLAWAYFYINEIEKAKGLINEVKLEDSPFYWTLKAQIALEDKDEENFLEYINKALKIDPTHPIARYILGVYYAKKGNIRRATSEIDLFVTEFPTYAHAKLLALLESLNSQNLNNNQ